MINRNMIISCALALTITGALGQSAYAVTKGWEQSNGGWHYYQNNTLKTGWIQDSGKWYYLSPSNGIMQTGWIQDGGNWYYLNTDGSMAHDTWIGSYYVGSSGAWTTTTSNTNSNYKQGKTASEIRKILKEDYGFVDYNKGLLLSPYGKDYNAIDGCYVNYQVDVSKISDTEIDINVLKDDSETISAVKAIFTMIFPNNADEAYSILTSFISSGESEKTYSLCGKTLSLYSGGDGKAFIAIE